MMQAHYINQCHSASHTFSNVTIHQCYHSLCVRVCVSVSVLLCMEMTLLAMPRDKACIKDSYAPTVYVQTQQMLHQVT